MVFAYPAPEAELECGWDQGLDPSIARRSIEWKKLDAGTATRAMRYGGHRDWAPAAPSYVVPDDDIQQFVDCDLWVVISDRVGAPLLPLRPYLLMAYDYSQRYDSIYPREADTWSIQAARGAQRVLVTTRFTEKDALVYAGVERSRVVRVPMIAPEFTEMGTPPVSCLYFLWATNLGRQKNHLNALLALRDYYESLDGQLDCHVTGVQSEGLLTTDAPHLPHLKPLAALVSQSDALSNRVRILGELPETEYLRQLAGAAFLWHPVRIDNGTFCVVEAAYLEVPSLSSRYPAMEEMNEQFQLDLSWMDAQQPGDMARQLKHMEKHFRCARSRLPSKSLLSAASVHNVAGEYWKVVRECL